MLGSSRHPVLDPPGVCLGCSPEGVSGVLGDVTTLEPDRCPVSSDDCTRKVSFGTVRQTFLRFTTDFACGLRWNTYDCLPRTRVGVLE